MKVVVVGGGIAGLSCAKRLQDLGHSVTLLEARPRVGGRLYGIEVAPGKWADAGGAYLGKKHTELLALVKELGLQVAATNTEGSSRFDVSGEVVTNENRFPPLSSVGLGTMFDSLYDLVESIETTAPWKSLSAEKLDNTTVTQWCEENLIHDDARLFFPLFLGEMMAADPNDISALHMAFYLSSGGGLQYLNAFEGGAQEYRIDGGAHQLCVKLGAAIGDSISLNTQVLSVHQDKSGASVTSSAGEIHCDKVVIALPPLLANDIDFKPSLDVSRAGSETSPGCVVKANVIYPTPVWREFGLSGWSVSARGPLLSTVDDSPADRSVGVLTGFITGEQAKEFSKLSAQQQVASVQDHVKHIFPEFPEPVDCHITDWTQEKYSRGCYAALFGPGDWIQQGPHITKPINNIFWAGTETSFEYFGLIEGALRSAKRVASEVHSSEQLREQSMKTEETLAI